MTLKLQRTNALVAWLVVCVSLAPLVASHANSETIVIKPNLNVANAANLDYPAVAGECHVEGFQNWYRVRHSSMWVPHQINTWQPDGDEVWSRTIIWHKLAVAKTETHLVRRESATYQDKKTVVGSTYVDSTPLEEQTTRERISAPPAGGENWSPDPSKNIGQIAYPEKSNLGLVISLTDAMMTTGTGIQSGAVQFALETLAQKFGPSLTAETMDTSAMWVDAVPAPDCQTEDKVAPKQNTDVCLARPDADKAVALQQQYLAALESGNYEQLEQIRLEKEQTDLWKKNCE